MGDSRLSSSSCRFKSYKNKFFGAIFCIGAFYMKLINAKTNFSDIHSEQLKEHLKIFFATKEFYDFSFSEETYEAKLNNFLNRIENAGGKYFYELPEFNDKSVILRNFGIFPLIVVARVRNFKQPEIFERIKVSVDGSNRIVSFKYCLSPLEVWLNSNKCRSGILSESKYPEYHPFWLKNTDGLSCYKDAKARYRKSNSSCKSNFDTQVKNYLAIIESVVGNDVFEICLKSNSDRVFQLVELLVYTKNTYGVSLKPIFSRLRKELSFSFFAKSSPIGYHIPSGVDDMDTIVKSFIENFYSPSSLNKNNANYIPAILKEILTYCIDAITDDNKRNLIKILPDIFEKTAEIISSENSENAGIYCDIGSFLTASDDVFFLFSYRLQMLLIGTYYRSKIELSKDVARFLSVKMSEGIYKKFGSDLDKMKDSFISNRKIYLHDRNAIYSQGTKLFLQILGVFWIVNGYKNYKEIESFDLSVSIKIVQIQREIEGGNHNFDFFKKYSPSKIKGLAKFSGKVLNEIERCARLALDSDLDISYFMEPLSINYVSLLSSNIFNEGLNGKKDIYLVVSKTGDILFPDSGFKDVL